MEYDANNRKSFNVINLLLLYCCNIICFHTVLLFKISKRKSCIVTTPAFTHYPYLQYGSQFHDVLRTTLDSDSLNKPLNRADFHCLNNVNVSLFIKFLLYGWIVIMCKNRRANILRKQFYIRTKVYSNCKW